MVIYGDYSSFENVNLTVVGRLLSTQEDQIAQVIGARGIASQLFLMYIPNSFRDHLRCIVEPAAIFKYHIFTGSFIVLRDS